MINFFLSERYLFRCPTIGIIVEENIVIISNLEQKRSLKTKDVI